MLLIGLDYLTINPPTEPTFPAHLELLSHKTLVLEDICLRHVPVGTYELLAAPIRECFQTQQIPLPCHSERSEESMLSLVI